LHGSHGVTPEHRVLRSLQFSQALFARNLGLDGPASDMRTDDINNMSTEAILPTTPGPGLANPEEVTTEIPAQCSLSLHSIFGQDSIQFGSLSTVG